MVVKCEENHFVYNVGFLYDCGGIIFIFLPYLTVLETVPEESITAKYYWPLWKLKVKEAIIIKC